jgi:hypothetical protein
MNLPRFQLYIDGAFVDAPATFDSVDPSTERPWATMPAAAAAEVDRAVRAAHRAFADPAWAGLTASARGKLLYRLADLVAAGAGRLAELETRDTGKIIARPAPRSAMWRNIIAISPTWRTSWKARTWPPTRPTWVYLHRSRSAWWRHRAVNRNFPLRREAGPRCRRLHRRSQGVRGRPGAAPGICQAGP